MKLSIAALALLIVAFAAQGDKTPASTGALRVCADPNNLPFSNNRREGFENKLAEMVAADAGKTVDYKLNGTVLTLTVPSIDVHEVVAIDL